MELRDRICDPKDVEKHLIIEATGDVELAERTWRKRKAAEMEAKAMNEG